MRVCHVRGCADARRTWVHARTHAHNPPRAALRQHDAGPARPYIHTLVMLSVSPQPTCRTRRASASSPGHGTLLVMRTLLELCANSSTPTRTQPRRAKVQAFAHNVRATARCCRIRRTHTRSTHVAPTDPAPRTRRTAAARPRDTPPRGPRVPRPCNVEVELQDGAETVRRARRAGVREGSRRARAVYFRRFASQATVPWTVPSRLRAATGEHAGAFPHFVHVAANWLAG